MRPDEITAFPPVLQLALLGVLASYVAVSILARIVPGLRHFWDSPRKAKGGGHVAKYTLLPALVLGPKSRSSRLMARAIVASIDRAAARRQTSQP